MPGGVLEEAQGREKESGNVLFHPMLPGKILYDLTVEDDHSFIIEGLVAHNSNCRCHLEFE
jgi:intein/homing endonuclease